jgi:hypothetical protein
MINPKDTPREQNPIFQGFMAPISWRGTDAMRTALTLMDSSMKKRRSDLRIAALTSLNPENYPL